MAVRILTLDQLSKAKVKGGAGDTSCWETDN